ncbi:hypothetical protein BD770DRAFT_377164 [Pilaira anomala]|nr:hypothetical protein BD770DRAFT_377164 [Pilaira anomala]
MASIYYRVILNIRHSQDTRVFERCYQRVLGKRVIKKGGSKITGQFYPTSHQNTLQFFSKKKLV